MKKLFFMATLLVAGVMSAKNLPSEKFTIKLPIEQVQNEKSEDAGWCQWCVMIEDNQYCAEGEDCYQAKKAARAMAMAEMADSEAR